MFHSQLEAVDRPTPRDRMGSGKTSPMRICRTSELLKFANEFAYPCTWTPCRGKEEDEDGNESDLSIDSRDVVCNRFTGSVEVSMVEANCDTNDGHQELTDQHAESAVDENGATSEFLNSVERDGC